jgi:hypothetical protein
MVVGSYMNLPAFDGDLMGRGKWLCEWKYWQGLMLGG